MASLRSTVELRDAANNLIASATASAAGLRLYYDSTNRPSRFDTTIAPDSSEDDYLHSDGTVCGNAQSSGVTTRSLDDTAPAAANPRCKDSGSVNFSGGNPFSLIGTEPRAPTVVFQTHGQQGHLGSVLAFDESLHVATPKKSLSSISTTFAFLHGLGQELPVSVTVEFSGKRPLTRRPAPGDAKPPAYAFDQFAHYVDTETVKWGKVVREAKITADEFALRRSDACSHVRRNPTSIFRWDGIARRVVTSDHRVAACRVARRPLATETGLAPSTWWPW